MAKTAGKEIVMRKPDMTMYWSEKQLDRLLDDCLKLNVDFAQLIADGQAETEEVSAYVND